MGEVGIQGLKKKWSNSSRVRDLRSLEEEERKELQ